MTLEQFQAGYLLRPGNDDERYGMKYFLNGWWMPNHESWFFKKEYIDNLLELGAEYISDVCLVDDYETDETEEVQDTQDPDYQEEVSSINSSDVKVLDTFDLTGIPITKYGRGFILIPPVSHKDYGTKYYGDGWWNTQQKGWFFKSDHLKVLLSAGAVIPTKRTRWDVEETHDTKLKEYGRGYIMIPKDTHPDFGEKYYKNGWWIGHGWFFKKEYVDEQTNTLME